MTTKTTLSPAIIAALAAADARPDGTVLPIMGKTREITGAVRDRMVERMNDDGLIWPLVSGNFVIGARGQEALRQAGYVCRSHDAETAAAAAQSGAAVVAAQLTDPLGVFADDPDFDEIVSHVEIIEDKLSHGLSGRPYTRRRLMLGIVAGICLGAGIVFAYAAWAMG